MMSFKQKLAVAAVMMSIGFSPRTFAEITASETLLLDELNYDITTVQSRVVENEIDGSLKKYEVAALRDRLNDLSDNAYAIANDGNFDEPTQNRLFKQLAIITTDLNKQQTRNLTYCRRKGICH